MNANQLHVSNQQQILRVLKTYQPETHRTHKYLQPDPPKKIVLEKKSIPRHEGRVLSPPCPPLLFQHQPGRQACLVACGLTETFLENTHVTHAS